jgi:hypothetical protein
MMLSGPDDDIINFMRAIGGRSSVNFPTPWLSDANSLFHQDLFLEFQYLFIGGFAPSTEVDLELTTGTIGTTLFMETTDWFRPFLQLGWSYNRSSASITGTILNTQQREDDHDLLIRGVQNLICLTTPHFELQQAATSTPRQSSLSGPLPVYSFASAASWSSTSTSMAVLLALVSHIETPG